MAKNTDWHEDSEAFGIALKLTDKFKAIFDGLDLTKVKFIRNMDGNSSKVGEIKICGFPYDTDSPYAYYICINNSYWKSLNDAQKTLAVMHFIYAICPGGTDETSNNYAKLRRHDVKDYNVILAAAGGRYDWAELGAIDIKNPLNSNDNDDYGEEEEEEI